MEGIRNRCREDIKWIPIIRLRADQVALLMCIAKVYIDFGPHPGKDRIPREAAVCGCCIITNREGSAEYSEDVGIPEEYKLFDMLNYDKVLDTIYDLIDNYDERVKEYEAYVKHCHRRKINMMNSWRICRRWLLKYARIMQMRRSCMLTRK